MRNQELKKMKELRQITPEVSMMANLQNVKQGLKSDYSDSQIADLILAKLGFTDLLINDHLRQLRSNRGDSKSVVHLPRDPAAFRAFIERQVPAVSPYSQFYLREAVKQGYPEGLYEEYMEAARNPK